MIVNAHLYASHLASGAMLLPAHEYVVFDEAHEILDIFATLLGTTLNAARLRALATRGACPARARARARADALLASAERFAEALLAQYERNELKGLDEALRGANSPAATRLVTALVERCASLPTTSPDEEFRKVRALGPAIHLANDLDRVGNVKDSELLYLTRSDREVDVEISLVDVGPRLRDDLWREVTGILTSATIPDTLPRNLGLREYDVEHFASPFDYKDHALLYVPARLSRAQRPGGRGGDHRRARRPHHRGRGAHAGALYQSLRDEARRRGGRDDASRPRFSSRDRSRVNGSSKRFRESAEASLFAVTSFWQGVDVPGHSLSLVTIDRLPFSVPGDPLAEARRERATRTPSWRSTSRARRCSSPRALADSFAPRTTGASSRCSTPDSRRRGTARYVQEAAPDDAARANARGRPRVPAGPARSSAGSVAEAIQDVVALLPTRLDAHAQLEVEALGQLTSRGDADVLQELAALADHHALLGLTLHQDLDGHVGPLELAHPAVDRVGQLLLGLAHQLLAHEFGDPGRLGDVGDLVVGEEERRLGHLPRAACASRASVPSPVFAETAKYSTAPPRRVRPISRRDLVDGRRRGEQLGGDGVAAGSVDLVHDRDELRRTALGAKVVEHRLDHVAVARPDRRRSRRRSRGSRPRRRPPSAPSR